MDERLRRRADRLATLLGDAHGAEVLATLQKLSLAQLADASPDHAGGSPDIGAWEAEPSADGVALRHRDVPFEELLGWADVPYVPPKSGAARVVLIGESSARGCHYTPSYSPMMVLERQLEKAAPGRYQCVDLARAGADVEELTRLAERLPLVEPDVVVVFAGNNWTAPPAAPDLRVVDSLARTLRADGYAAVRQAFIREVILPRARGFLDQVTAVRRHGARVVVVVPEFNLRGWGRPAGVDVPVLANGGLAQWFALYDAAAAAGARRQWDDVAEIAERMRRLDGGTSPVPGRLIAQAALARRDGPAARAGLEYSRDAIVGLGLDHTPRVLAQVRELLLGYAARDGLACVDLGSVLAADDLPELPDDRFFLDFCHLSDAGIERVMAAVADAVLGLPPGTTAPGSGADPPVRALAYVMAAIQGAYLGQPAEVVAGHLRGAVAADPEITAALEALLDVLESTGPAWIQRAIPALAAIGHASAFFGPMLLNSRLPDEMWTLRACLGDLLGRTPPADTGEIDLFATAKSTGGQSPLFRAEAHHHRATTRQSVFAFAMRRPRPRTLDLTYRTCDAPPDATAEVTLNETPVAVLPGAGQWSAATVELPAAAIRPGVNRVEVRWPVPTADLDRHIAADAAALARGELPFVLPVFGEVFTARLRESR